MSKSGNKKTMIRVISLVLAGLMVIGVGTTAIFVLVDFFKQDNKNNEARIETQMELSDYSKNWEV